MSTMTTFSASLNFLEEVVQPRQAPTRRTTRYGLDIRPGDKLCYALWDTMSQQGGDTGRCLEFEVESIETELRMARDMSTSVALDTPVCVCSCDGQRLDGDIWRQTFAGQVAYPVETRFWGCWMAVERSWDGLMCDGLPRPHALFEQGVITLHYVARVAGGASAAVTIDRQTGVVLQAQRRRSDGTVVTALLVNHTIGGSPV